MSGRQGTEGTDFFESWGSDTVSGLGGRDFLSFDGGPGPYSIYYDGGDGDDFLNVVPLSGSATLIGGAGNDYIESGSLASVTINAGSGVDEILLIEPVAAGIALGDGGDQVRLSPRPGGTPIVITDFQTGDAGDSIALLDFVTLPGWDGASNPFALGYFRLVQRGTDTILEWDQDGAAGAFGFADMARFEFTSASAFTALNALGWSPNGGVEGVVHPGTPGDDVYFGTPTGDSISGGEGSDRVRAEAGDDSISGGAGNETIFGMDGADRIFGDEGNDDIQAGDGLNYVRGGDGGDTLRGGAQFDDLHGGPGEDQVLGFGGGDWVVGGQGNDTLGGGDGDDVVYGNLGNDFQDGGDGNDWVRGGQGNDNISAGAGSDFVAGDRGNDTISGGAGADLFHAFSGIGLDRITDFNAAEGDRVNLMAGTSYTVSQSGADTVVDLGAGDQVVLVGVQLSTLPAGWIFVG